MKRSLIILHVKLAPEPLLDKHTAHLAVEVAEDVGKVGAPGVAGDHRRLALSLGLGEDGGALTFERGTDDRLLRC